jgi:antitoxin ParD1/3/4
MGMTVSVTPQLDRFVKEQVASGKYASSSEVVRAGLRLLADQEEARAQRQAALKRFVQEGLDDLESGKLVEAKSVFARVRKIIDEAENQTVVEISAAGAR